MDPEMEMAAAADATPGAGAGKTASTQRAAFVKGTHQLDIVGYSVFKALGRSHSVKSGTFRVVGHDWAVLCCFDGHRLADVSLELLSTSDPPGGVTAMASFTIHDPTGKGKGKGKGKGMQIGNPEEGKTFTRSSRTCKLPVPEAFQEQEARFVTKDDDRLTIRCTLHVLTEESHPTSYCFVAAPLPPSISRSLGKLLETRQRTDVTFAVEGSTFDAHKLVLAMRSPVFRAKFFGDTRDSSQHWFRVHDMRATVFSAMLHFIYTDELPPAVCTDDDDMAPYDLLVAADLYDLERLRLMCEKMLWDSTRKAGDVGSAISTLALVNGRHNCRQLEDLCVGYIAGAWEAVTATEEYRELKSSSPAALNDILEKVMDHRRLGHQLRPPSSSSSGRPPPEKSASTYRPWDVSRGTHMFTIFGYSAVQRTHGLGEFIQSGTFDVGGREWRILYYPSGYDTEDQGHASVVLKLQSCCIDPDVMEVAGTLKICNPNGETTYTRDFGHDFTHDDKEALVDELFTMDEAKSCHVGPDDSLTVGCHFEVTTKKSSPSSPASGTTITTSAGSGDHQHQEIVVSPCNISWHLERLLETKLGSDVTFLVDGSKFHAHALVLSARSPALLKEAETKVATKKKKKTKIGGMKAVVFKAMLHFIYTDELPPLDGLVRAAGGDAATAGAVGRTRMAGDLLAAAERYQLVERMGPMCENLLCEVITPENAATTLRLAKHHRRPELEAFCLDYISSPGVLKAVVAADDWISPPRISGTSWTE